MKRLLIQETIVAVVFIGALLLLLTHGNLSMLETYGMIICVGLVILFMVFAGLVWKEQAADERDQMHRDAAGRVSFLVGIGILVTGAIYQVFTSEVDPWIVWALVGMVGAKIASRIISFYKN